ncbi:hypothetical protein K458DRAFT_411998 [Lentithecium fluviatile CBS 122367]|uniref:Uncharacterized protein n=1 Tax=Lentithecium fluviatile CBS 122367 TaxID=1168545 RepID=A0A6G1JJP1_9PLEO|nr:hypothetical protein K458DRAFT_411998 [Lentithecium fluviatile CBS 122367]
MGLSKLKAKLFPNTNTKTHGTPEITGTPTPPSQSPIKPKEQSTTSSQLTASENTSTTTRTGPLTAEELKLEKSLGVSDAKREASAEQRRAYIRAYLRDGRDKARWNIYGFGGG